MQATTTHDALANTFATPANDARGTDDMEDIEDEGALEVYRAAKASAIEALANDPDVGPCWPAITERGQLEASPGQVAAFAEACSVHGLDGLDTQEIVGLLRAHGRPDHV